MSTKPGVAQQCREQFLPVLVVTSLVLVGIASPAGALKFTPQQALDNWAGPLSVLLQALLVGVNLLAWPAAAIPRFARRRAAWPSNLPRPPDVQYLLVVWLVIAVADAAALAAFASLDGLLGVRIAAGGPWALVGSGLAAGGLIVSFRYWRMKRAHRKLFPPPSRTPTETGNGLVWVLRSEKDMDLNLLEYVQAEVELAAVLKEYQADPVNTHTILDRSAVALAEKVSATRHAGISVTGSPLYREQAVRLPALFHYLRYKILAGTGCEYRDLERAVTLYNDLRDGKVPPEIRPYVRKASRDQSPQRSAPSWLAGEPAAPGPEEPPESSCVWDLRPGPDDSTVADWAARACYGDPVARYRIQEIIEKLYARHERHGSQVRRCPLARKIESMVNRTSDGALLDLQDEHESNLVAAIQDAIFRRQAGERDAL